MPEGKASWWASNGHKFFAAGVITAASVLLVGWFTDAREVMHGALLSIAVVALLPFAIIAIALLVMLVIGLVIALPAAVVEADIDLVGADAIGDVALEGGGKMIPWYYGLFARQRHPVFWGIPTGVLLGGLLLWGALALTRLPRESDTAETLQRAKVEIERIYQKDGSFPKPDRGHLIIGGVTYKDGFGQPLVYDVTGAWKLATWTLRSHGFDEKPGNDDLCIGGETKLIALAERTVDKYTGIQSLRCD